jgi:hypothetical protein
LALLVLDEQLEAKSLVVALTDRGLAVKTLGDYGLTGRPDPDVVRRIDERQSGMWVLVTMDLGIVEHHPGFDWDRYAIAWILVHKDLRGVKFEQSKRNIVHKYAHEMVQQARGDQHSYSEQRRTKSRPSLSSQLRRRL